MFYARSIASFDYFLIADHHIAFIIFPHEFLWNLPLLLIFRHTLTYLSNLSQCTGFFSSSKTARYLKLSKFQVIRTVAKHLQVGFESPSKKNILFQRPECFDDSHSLLFTLIFGIREGIHCVQCSCDTLV